MNSEELGVSSQYQNEPNKNLCQCGLRKEDVDKLCDFDAPVAKHKNTKRFNLRFFGRKDKSI